MLSKPKGFRMADVVNSYFYGSFKIQSIEWQHENYMMELNFSKTKTQPVQRLLCIYVALYFSYTIKTIPIHGSVH